MLLARPHAQARTITTLDVPLAGHDHQERPLGDEEGKQGPGRTHESGQGDAAALGEDGTGPTDDLEPGERAQPACLLGSGHG